MPCPGTYWKTAGLSPKVRRSPVRGNGAVVHVRVLRRRLRKTAGIRPATSCPRAASVWTEATTAACSPRRAPSSTRAALRAPR